MLPFLADEEAKIDFKCINIWKIFVRWNSRSINDPVFTYFLYCVITENPRENVWLHIISLNTDLEFKPYPKLYFHANIYLHTKFPSYQSTNDNPMRHSLWGVCAWGVGWGQVMMGQKITYAKIFHGTIIKWWSAFFNAGLNYIIYLCALM